MRINQYIMAFNPYRNLEKLSSGQRINPAADDASGPVISQGSTIANLQVTTENLSASESRIRDTDMALEMVSFTRHQVLVQAGAAMLALANSAPQSVLRLLQ